MDVTCDRCQTQYEFDDALVSEAGTSVRCTQCGFKFRVRREGSASPEVWVVRTVDGRELEFRALRDLKSSISTGRIGRDDVLSRGAGRPRRLASIAELEPFFATPRGLSNTAVGLGDEPRPRSRTPHGLGPYVPPQQDPDRTENSVAFSLPKLAQEAAQATPRRHREGMNTANYGTPLVGPPESVDPDTNRVARVSSKRATPRGLAPPPMADDDVTQSKARSAITGAPPVSLTGTTLGTGPREPSPYDDLDVATTARGALPLAADSASALTATVPRTNGTPEPPAVAPAAAVAPSAPPARTEPSDPPPPVLARTKKISDDELARVRGADRESEPPAASRSAALPQPSGPAAEDVERERHRDDSIPPPEVHRTPAPENRFSMSGEDGIGSDPRFTALSARAGTASGSTRLIVGLLVLGALAFVAVLIVQKFVVSSGAKTPAKQDDRVTTLVQDGEKALRDGDLEGANDQFVRAAELGQSDARPAKALARLANIRAEFPCLKAELLPESDADRETAVSDCAAAAARAQKAAQKARSLAATDAEVTRAEIDAKRLGGDVAGARQLVPKISEVQAQPESGLVLAALDLKESRPPWDSVIERLTKAAAEEGELGRARALLVYALGRSGNVKGAREELAKLAKSTRPHPLKATLTKYLDRADKGELPARVDDLPSASPSSSGFANNGGAFGSTTPMLLNQASSALARRDLNGAERLYQQVLDREPHNSEALAGMAEVARKQGNTGRAEALNQRALEENNGYIPAIVSGADLKWAKGDHAGAAALYGRALELDPNGDYAGRARERIATARSETPPPSSSDGATTGGAATEPTTPPTTPPPSDGASSGGPAPDPTDP